jgi:hypothetical protein
MISFPKYQPLKTVLKAVKSNTAKDAEKLPTIAYIGFPEPQGTKAVIELDNTGEVIGTSTKAALKWTLAHAGACTLMMSNLITAHGALPANMTLSLVGYIKGDTFTIVDAQLAVDCKYSVFWLSVSVLDQIVNRVSDVKTAFSENALYAEVDFNNVDEFIQATEAVAKAGEVTLWQVSPHSEIAEALVLRDPYRIVL